MAIGKDTALRLMLVDDQVNEAEAIVSRLREADINPISLTLTQPTLDDVFLQVTGQRLRDESATPAPAPAAKSRR